METILDEDKLMDTTWELALVEVGGVDDAALGGPKELEEGERVDTWLDETDCVGGLLVTGAGTLPFEVAGGGGLF
jgi:hypothetical protein